MLGLLAAVGSLYTVLRAADSLWSLPGRARQWRELKRERAFREQAEAALRDPRAFLEFLATQENGLDLFDKSNHRLFEGVSGPGVPANFWSESRATSEVNAILKGLQPPAKK